MDLRKIKKLMEMVEESGIAELEVRSGDESVRIVRPLSGGTAPAVAAAPAAGRPVQAEGYPVRAPMAGTFYAAPEPGADAYVSEGDAVRAGSVLCIIESMKMMNEIKADRSGVCTAVCVANGQAVSSGDVLFRIA
jgi:acetyl-CoA carboxylase biotin carboxyl carrier protein